MLNFQLTSLGSGGPHKHLTSGMRDFGPVDLSEVAFADVEVLRASGTNWHRQYTKDDFSSLIAISFFASLSTYEGRMPRFSLRLEGDSSNSIDTLTFSPEKPLDVDNLRGLAPLCQREGAALSVGKRDSRLLILGLTTLMSGDERFDIGLPAPRTHFIYENNIVVHILGPGKLRVFNGVHEYELNCGQLRQCTSLDMLPRIKTLCEGFAHRVASAIREKGNLSQKQEGLIPIVCQPVAYERLIVRMLQQVLNSGSGGSILIVPDGPPQEIAGHLHALSPNIGLDLFHAAVAYGHAALMCQTEASSPSLNEEMLNSLAAGKAKLILATKTIADLCSVDGCVVLDQQLRIQGFGVKINTTKENATESKIIFRRVTNKSEMTLDFLEKLGGTRWRSAIWFCKSLQLVTAFVVSQDRNLKVCWSEEEDAFAYGPVTLPTKDH